MLGRAAIELDKKIDVALFGVEITASRRAEQIEPPHMKAMA
jgi:hypothetical protein